MIDWSLIPPVHGLDCYILVDRQPVAIDDFVEMVRWKHENPELVRVACDQIGDATVSTVFLGMDQNGGFGRRPLLFETMVFGGPLHHEQERYWTYDEALAGHDELVTKARGAIDRVNAIAVTVGAARK